MDKRGSLSNGISIYVNGDLNTEIHTSCSKPIDPGLVSGDFEVVEGYSKDGGLLCESSYDNDDDGKSNDDDGKRVTTMMARVMTMMTDAKGRLLNFANCHDTMMMVDYHPIQFQE